MRKLLTIFLISNLLTACSLFAPKKSEPLNVNWQFIEVVPLEKPMACLNQIDVEKLAERLTRCQPSGQNYSHP
jgi:hypothetical protein